MSLLSFLIRNRLRKAEIIPTVVDDFIPSWTLQVAWQWPETSKHNVTTKLGNTIDPDLLQDPPNAYLDMDPASSVWKKKQYPEIVLTMSDPDAPSRDDPKWSEVCHWIVAAHGKRNVTEVMPYKPPGPPPKTGKHRYVFLAWIPANRTVEELTLEKPKGRKHWGYDPSDGVAGRVGVRKWASEMGLIPVAANFIYAQNEEQ